MARSRWLALVVGGTVAVRDERAMECGRLSRPRRVLHKQGPRPPHGRSSFRGVVWWQFILLPPRDQRLRRNSVDRRRRCIADGVTCSQAVH